eukprot:g3401.t1
MSASEAPGKAAVAEQTNGEARTPRKVGTWRRRPKFAFTTCVVEESEEARAIYNVAFCNLGGNFGNIFATVGGNRTSIYECLDDGHIDVRQVYVDDDDKEDLYTCKWTYDKRFDSPLLVVGGYKGIAKVIDCRKQCMVNALIGHGNSINEISVHPVDEYLVFTASKDESIRLWNVANGVCIAIFAGDQGHRDEVLSLDVHLVGNCFASCGMDNTVKVWALDSEKLVSAVEDSYDVQQGVSRLYVPSAPSEATPTSTDNETAAQPSGIGNDGENGGISSGASNSEGDEQANGAGTISSKNFSKKPFATRFFQFPAYSTSKVHSDYVDCVRWMGDLLLSKSTGNKICLWKPAPARGPDSASILREFTMTDAEIWFVRFEADNNLDGLACGNRCGQVFLWNIHDNDDIQVKPMACLTHIKCTATVRHVAFSPDRKTILACCDDGSLWRYDLKNANAGLGKRKGKKKRKFT